MENKKIRHLHQQFKTLSPWYFLAGALVFGVIGVFALRQNNLNAIELREKVNQVDKENGDVEAALKELREYTYSHMNASLRSETGVQQPIQLKYRYERLVKAEKKRVTDANEDVYTKAQKYCEARYPAGTLRSKRVPCIQSYVKKYSTTTEQAIPDALYKFDFVAPAWSADLAGISLLLSVILFIFFVIRFMIERWFKEKLKED